MKIKSGTIQGVIVAQLRLGKTNAEAFARVQRRFPTSSVGIETVNWWRNKLRESGEKIPSNADAAKKGKKNV